MHPPPIHTTVLAADWALYSAIHACMFLLHAYTSYLYIQAKKVKMTDDRRSN
jgi:hypothetical protein